MHLACCVVSCRGARWKIFEAIERNSKVSTGGYSGLLHVDIDHPNSRSNKDDKMESFFLAETLKYLVRPWGVGRHSDATTRASVDRGQSRVIALSFVGRVWIPAE